MGVVVFQPSVAPFVQQAALALHEADALAAFVTTVADEPRRLRQRALCAVARLAGRDLAPQFRRRSVSALPPEKVATHPWGELLRLAVGAIDRDGRATDLVWETTERAFDRRVARRLHRGVTGVYGFEHSSLATFTHACSLGLPIAYDVPAPDSEFVHRLLAGEMERFPELRTAYHRHTAKREARRLARRRAEWHAADVIIAASHFTKRSYEQAGLPAAAVHIVPYGAPPPLARDAALAARPASAPLTLLWAGTFSIRKGAHYLLEAWRQRNLGAHARLRVFGAVTLPERALRPLPDGVELCGSIPREQLLREYHHADALIFPTLCDGFGMVVTEAWSRGLPVITTPAAGAVDLLQPQRNGLLVEPGNASSITETLDWCFTHRADLAAMREAALATAAAWQWSDYRQTLARVLRDAGFLPRTA